MLNKKSLVSLIPIVGIVALTTLVGGVPRAGAVEIVVPNAQAASEGNWVTIGPFGTSNIRYHQVYAASDFTPFTTLPLIITQIAFRPDESYNAFSDTLDDIQINMSTTSAGPDTLSLTFADNVGIDDTVVYTRGTLDLSSSFTGPSGGPMDFDIIITFALIYLRQGRGHARIEAWAGRRKYFGFVLQRQGAL